MGAEPPCHIHGREDEIVYVVRGDVTFYAGDAPIPAPASACLYLPRGLEHGFAVETAEATLLTMHLPGSFEGYIKDMGMVATLQANDPPGDAAAIERMVTIAARYGCEIMGPSPGRRANQRGSE